MGAAEVSPKLVISATLCCGCGVCENLACSQGISPKSVIANYKELLAKNKMRYVATEAVIPSPEREYRMIPSKKWEMTLGVARFNKLPEYIGYVDAERVEISLGGHIGAPSVALVKSGDTVCAGDLIAEAAAGLSVCQHASISGRVILATDKIIIDKVN